MAQILSFVEVFLFFLRIERMTFKTLDYSFRAYAQSLVRARLLCCDHAPDKNA
jgi:hypothetical protein